MDLEPWCQNPQIWHHWFEVERLTDSRRFVLLTVRFSKVDPCLKKKNKKRFVNRNIWAELRSLSEAHRQPPVCGGTGGLNGTPYLPLWWGWAPDCCRRTAGQPLQSVSSWWWARMGRAPNRFDYIPEADLVQTPDLLMGPLMFLEPVSCCLSPHIHPTSCF